MSVNVYFLLNFRLEIKRFKYIVFIERDLF